MYFSGKFCIRHQIQLVRSTLSLPWNHISTHTFPKKKKYRKLSSAPFTLPFIAPHQLNTLLCTWLAPEPPESVHCLSSCASWCWVHCFCCHATPCHASFSLLFLPQFLSNLLFSFPPLIFHFTLLAPCLTLQHLSPQSSPSSCTLPTRMELLLRPVAYSHPHSAQLV